jgi:hypothetical protein
LLPPLSPNIPTENITIKHQHPGTNEPVSDKEITPPSALRTKAMGNTSTENNQKAKSTSTTSPCLLSFKEEKSKGQAQPDVQIKR